MTNTARTLLAAFALIATSSNSTVAMAKEKLVVATYAYPGLDRYRSLQPLAELIFEQSGIPVEIELHESPTQLAEAIESGSIDVAIINLTGFLQLTPSSKAFTAKIKPDVAASTADRYRSVVVKLKASPIKLNEISARNVSAALVWKDSTSGGIVPMSYFQSIGIDSPAMEFRSLTYVGSHASSLMSVLSGEVDIAGLAESALDKEEDLGQLNQKLEIIWRSDPIPAAPIICVDNPLLSCQSIEDALLERSDTSQGIARAIAMGWPEFEGITSFTKANGDDYAKFYQAYKTLNTE